ASLMVKAYINHMPWSQTVNRYDEMGRLTKEDIVAFANKHFGENYVQVNKRLGKNEAVKVEKPTITPVNIDRETKSDFFVKWDSIQTERLEPVFIDYDEAIDNQNFDNGIEFSSIKNENNDLFSLYYILDMGTDNDLEMGLAIDYLPFLGTSEMSAED